MRTEAGGGRRAMVAAGLLGVLSVGTAVLATLAPGSSRPPSSLPAGSSTGASRSASAPEPSGGHADGGGQSAPEPAVVEALWFTTRQDGFVGLSTGLFATSDGGRTWAPRLGGVAITKLMFVDPAHGWAVAKDRLFRTADGGRSWQPADEPSDAIDEVQFVDASRGWAVTGSQALAITDDGGSHWSIERPPGNAQSGCFSDRTHGWVVGHNNTIETTADGGQHWAFAYHLRSAVEPDLQAVAHCRQETVWVVFTGNGAASKQNYTLVVGTGPQWKILAHNWGFAPEPTLADAPNAPAFGDYSGPFTVLAPDLAILTGMPEATSRSSSPIVTSPGPGTPSPCSTGPPAASQPTPPSSTPPTAGSLETTTRGDPSSSPPTTAEPPGPPLDYHPARHGHAHHRQRPRCRYRASPRPSVLG